VSVDRISKFFRAPTYWAHRVVIFATAQLSWLPRCGTVGGRCMWEWHGIDIYIINTVQLQRLSLPHICTFM